MDVDKTIKVKSNDDKVVVELSTKAASKSGLLKGIIEDYPEDSEFPLTSVDGKTLEKVKEYLTHYQDEDPKNIEKPLKSNKFEECANEARAAAPTKKLTVPSVVSPPAGFESIIAGSAELYAEAIRFIPARKNMSFSTTGQPLSHSSPDFADESSDSLFSPEFFGSGM